VAALVAVTEKTHLVLVVRAHQDKVIVEVLPLLVRQVVAEAVLQVLVN
jgi:hypothetical protein